MKPIVTGSFSRVALNETDTVAFFAPFVLDSNREGVLHSCSRVSMASSMSWKSSSPLVLTLLLEMM